MILSHPISQITLSLYLYNVILLYLFILVHSSNGNHAGGSLVWDDNNEEYSSIFCIIAVLVFAGNYVRCFVIPTCYMCYVTVYIHENRKTYFLIFLPKGCVKIKEPMNQDIITTLWHKLTSWESNLLDVVFDAFTTSSAQFKKKWIFYLRFPKLNIKTQNVRSGRIKFLSISERFISRASNVNLGCR